MGGTGKWYGLTGEGTIDGSKGARTDGGRRFEYTLDWQIREGNQKVSSGTGPGPFKNRLTGFGFHNTHNPDRVIDPGKGDGTTLVHNYQQQKYIIEDPEAPMYMTSGYWQGTAIHDADDKVLMDVGFKTFIRPDGDAVFWLTNWWYAEGPAELILVGGTGPWKTIQGRGRTLPFDDPDRRFGPRVDRAWILEFDLTWQVD
jgi:hypothetical protein